MTDPVDILVQVIHAELLRQTNADGITGFYFPWSENEAKLDGVFDLHAIARAILKSGVTT